MISKKKREEREEEDKSCGSVCCLKWVFFFSSRRRHTRSLCDWSSDVCSSDLEERLDQGRGEVADEDDRRRLRVRQAVRVSEERQHGGDRALVQVDDEMKIGRASCRERV